MDGNPILKNDSDGDCPSCIGAIVGAIVDAGLQLTEIALTDKPLSKFSFSSVAASAASGAIGVGIATKIEKAIKVANIASKATTAIIKITTSAATDAAASAGGQLVKRGKVDAGEVVIDVIAGQTVGRVAGNLVEKVAKKSSAAKVLAKQADRAKRVASIPAPRPTRVAAAKQAAKKSENYVARRGAAAGTAASGVASDAVKRVIGVGEESKKK